MTKLPAKPSSGGKTWEHGGATCIWIKHLHGCQMGPCASLTAYSAEMERSPGDLGFWGSQPPDKCVCGSFLTITIPPPLPTVGLFPLAPFRSEPLSLHSQLRPVPLQTLTGCRGGRRSLFLGRLWMGSPGQEPFYPVLVCDTGPEHAAAFTSRGR